jgi:hypothetical protein
LRLEKLHAHTQLYTMLLVIQLPPPNLTFGSFIINEPMGSLTNVLIALTALVAFSKIVRIQHSTEYLRYWKLFFITMSVSMFYAGCTHAFKWMFTPEQYKYVWLSMNLLGIVPTFFATQASLSINPNKFFNPIVYTLLMLVIVFTIAYNDFTFVKIAAALGVFSTIYIHALLIKRVQFAPSQLIIAGMCLGVFTIVVHTLKISLHTWFNYKDISHVIMAVSVWILHLGVNRYDANAITQQTT